MVFVCALLHSCGAGVRMLTGIKSPVVETKSEVQAYWEAQNPNTPTFFFQPPKDTIALYTNMLRSFHSDIMLFDASGVRLCYTDTEACLPAQIHAAGTSIDKDFEPCSSQEFSLSDLISDLQHSDGTAPKLNPETPPDYYLIVFWSKFAASPKELRRTIASYHNITQQMTASVNMVYVNTDLLDEFGLEKGEKLRFSYKPSKAGFTINLGDMPYKKNRETP